MTNYVAFVLTTREGEDAGFALMTQEQYSAWPWTVLDYAEMDEDESSGFDSVGEFLYADHSSRHSNNFNEWPDLVDYVSTRGGTIINVEIATIPQLWSDA